MTKEEFLNHLKALGCPEPVLVVREPKQRVDLHQHDFEARALITEGDITIEVDGVSTTYKVGDVFHLTRNQPHTEQYGVNGVTYLASRIS